MHTIQTIIFDLGGVLIDWDPRYLYRKLFASATEMEHFLATVTTPAWNEEQDAGRSLAEATSLLVGQYPEQEVMIRAFYSRWVEMLGGPIAGTLAILEQLYTEKQYDLFALTNWSAETWPIATELYPFLGWFQGILVSGQEKMRKPDPAFYRLLEARFPLQLESALFIDDSLRNVEAARALGLRTIHFQDPTQLRIDMATYGVLLA